MKKYLIKKGQRLSPQTEFKKGEHASSKTEFKKGQSPCNKKPIGYITIRKDKSGTKRRYIKIGEGGYEWKVYATWLWENKRGAVPNGMFIHHKDEDSLNDNLKNYKLTNRAKHAVLHRKNLIEKNPYGRNGKPK